MDHLLTSRKASRKDHPSGAGHTARGRRDLPRRTRVPPKSCARPRCPHAQPHRSSSFHHLPCCLSSSFSEQYGVQRNRGQLTQTMRSAGMDTERRRLVSLALPPRSVSKFQKSDSAPCDIVLDVCSAECQG